MNKLGNRSVQQGINKPIRSATVQTVNKVLNTWEAKTVRSTPTVKLLQHNRHNTTGRISRSFSVKYKDFQRATKTGNKIQGLSRRIVDILVELLSKLLERVRQ